MFVDGKVEPVCIRNYNRPWRYGEYYAEPEIPRAQLVRGPGSPGVVNLKSASPLPSPCLTDWSYGKEYSLYQIGAAPGLIEGKMLPHELLFLRYNLKAGENRFSIELLGNRSGPTR